MDRVVPNLFSSDVTFLEPIMIIAFLILYANHCECRIQVSRKHHQLLIIPRREMSSFLADMPDSLSLSSLLLPGTNVFLLSVFSWKW